MEDHAKSAHHEGGSNPYVMLAVNLGLSLLVMYLAMFAMIWSWGEFIQNVNFFYMALVMWAPMGAIMLATMGGMYRRRRLNAVLYAAFAAIFVLWPARPACREPEDEDRRGEALTQKAARDHP